MEVWWIHNYFKIQLNKFKRKEYGMIRWTSEGKTGKEPIGMIRNHSKLSFFILIACDSWWQMSFAIINIPQFNFYTAHHQYLYLEFNDKWRAYEQQTSLIKFNNIRHLLQLLEDCFCPSTISTYQLQQYKAMILTKLQLLMSRFYDKRQPCS